MNSLNSTYAIWFDGITVGHIDCSSEPWQFSYHPQWLNHPENEPLAPFMPLVDEAFHSPQVNAFFEPLLAAQRSGEATTFEPLGGLVLLPKDSARPESGLEALTYEQLLSVLSSDSREKYNGLFSLVEDNKQFCRPLGSMPSNLILKSNREIMSGFSSVFNEWLCMKLAGNSGLKVAEVQINYIPEPVYCVKRVDRFGQATHQHRLLAGNGRQMLGLHQDSQTDNDPTALHTLVNFADKKAKTRLRLYHWCVFNTLIGNHQADLNDLAFVVNDRGFSLAPFYGLKCSILGSSGDPLEMTAPSIIGVHTSFKRLSRAILIDFATNLGLPARVAENEMDKLLSKLIKTLKSVHDDLKRSKDKERSGELLKHLRELQYSVILPMITRLSA